MNHTPINLYSAQAVKQLDSIAIHKFAIPGYELMTRAGRVLFLHLQTQYPQAKCILVCCGAGNNAGDGYVLAKLAHEAGLRVNVISLVDPNNLKGDAKKAWQDWHNLGNKLNQYSNNLLQRADLVVDALIGTGLQRALKNNWADLVIAINNSKKPVLAVDIPSGLCANTGSIFGQAILATSTVTFIGLKKGLLTNFGVEYCGELSLDELSIPSGVYTKQTAQAQILDWTYLKTQLKSRKANAYKHQLGHVYILGGDQGMPGAIRLAAEAALRVGAGLVTVVTHKKHMAPILAGCPELMIYATEDGHLPDDYLNKATVIVIGPGLVDSPWSNNLFDAALKNKAPKVIDAGALRLLAKKQKQRINWVLTPHAGEAAALLNITPNFIQNNRYNAIEQLHQKYKGHIVLKGAGSLVQSPDEITQLCPYGNPGMASPGMGDVLSGVIASLIAQGYNLTLAVQIGVCLHSMAGDRAALNGMQGLLASDLFVPLRQLINDHV